MKKIEQQICESFNHAQVSRLSSRDKVEWGFTSELDYYLHDSRIFTYNFKKEQFKFSLRGYNTVTTRSRLRALLAYFCHAQLSMKNGKLLLITSDGVQHEINANDIYSLTVDEKLKNVA